MHTEGQIRLAIRPLLELYGKLDTTQIKSLLEEVLDFDEEDMVMSETRTSEMKIIQRIGNIISHQTENVKIYPEGFIIDKSSRPAVWSAITGLSKNVSELPTKLVDEKKKKVSKHNSQRPFRKINWELENERRSCIGLAGEAFVYELEKEKVTSFDAVAVSRVIHLSAKQGDGFGYDILSLNENGETIYIEVKTTTATLNTPFYMSKNEKFFFENNVENNAFLYRVYDFNVDSRHGKVKKITAKELFENYDFDPVSFMVTPKQA